MPVGVEEKYFGYDGFVWFFGVVEDLNDPEQVSRVRVRVLGHNPSDKVIVPTEDLPWAQVMMPTTSASVSGVGHSPHGLMLGSYVLGFYLDGKYAQLPMVLGTWHGIPQELSNPEEGFNDPTGVFPREVNEPDTSKLSRGINTIPNVIDSKIDPPASSNTSVYPHNKVYETESGHIVEIDDTPSFGRIRIRANSGTFVEIHPNGDVVQSNKNRWQITTGDDKAHITGNLNVFIDKDALVEIGQNAYVKVENDAQITVGNNVTQTVGGNVDSSVGGNVTQSVTGNVTQTVKGNVTGKVEGNLNMDISKAATITVPETTWTGNITVKGNITQNGNYTQTGTFAHTGTYTQTGNHNVTGNIAASGGITFAGGTGSFSASGTASFPSTVAASGDITSDGVSLKTHTHTITGGSSAGTTSTPN